MKRVRLYLLENYQPREHTSASRVQLHMRCERQIGFKSLLGLRPEEGFATWLDLGKATHKQLENYAHGQQLDMNTEAGKRALSCLHLLPDFRTLTHVETEAPIKLDTRRLWPNLEPIQIRGSRDLAYGCSGPAANYQPWWNLIDYKTTRGDTKHKNPWAYQITEEKLLNDVQGNWYALDLMINKGVTTVPARWISILTDLKRHPDARVTDVVFNYTDVVAKSRQFLEVSDRFRSLVRQYRKQPFDINGLKADTEQCEQYGGCPYRAANGGPCKDQRTLGEMFRMTQQTDVEAMLAQRAAQGPGGGAPPGYGPPPNGGPPPGYGPPPGPPQGYAPQPPQQQQGAYPPPPPQAPQQQPQAPGMPGIPPGYGAPPQGQPMPPAPPQPGYGPPPQQQPMLTQAGYGPPPQQGYPQAPNGYTPPHAPHLPPEAQHAAAPPPPPPHPMAAGQGVPQLPPAGAAAPAPAKKGRKPKAVVPATQGLEAEDVEERAAFMRLFVATHFEGLGAGNIDPNYAQQLATNATSLANLAWIALQAAGA